MKLLTKLNAGDMIAQEAKYHRNCLLNLYNRTRKSKEMASKGTDDEHAIEGLAFAELVVCIEEALMDNETVPVLKLTDLAQMYTQGWNSWESSVLAGCTRPVLNRDCLLTFLTCVHSTRDVMSCLHSMKTLVMPCPGKGL